MLKVDGHASMLGAMRPPSLIEKQLQDKDSTCNCQRGQERFQGDTLGLRGFSLEDGGGALKWCEDMPDSRLATPLENHNKGFDYCQTVEL